MNYVGLDTATTTGIAIYRPKDNLALVTEVKGNPLVQFKFMHILLGRNAGFGQYVVVMEKLHHFRNADTTRSLLQLSGYLKYRFMEEGVTVEEDSPSIVRKYFGVATKEGMRGFFLPWFDGEKLTSNHTDALALALKTAFMRKEAIEWKTFKIREVARR